MIPVLLLLGCWRDPHADRTQAAHARILAEARYQRQVEDQAFSLIGSCDEVATRGECTESWERDEHRKELRTSTWGWPTGDPVVGRKDGYRKACEQRQGSFSDVLCPTAGALGERVSGTSEARLNVARVERFYTAQALGSVERSCRDHPRPGCAVTRLAGP